MIRRCFCIITLATTLISFQLCFSFRLHKSSSIKDQYGANNIYRHRPIFYFSDKIANDKYTDYELTLTKYDANQINSYYSKRPFLVWERLVDIGSPILGWWILKKIDQLLSPYRSADENLQAVNERACDLRDAIKQGKSVTFIKSGQALALRPDLIKSPE